MPDRGKKAKRIRHKLNKATGKEAKKLGGPAKGSFRPVRAEDVKLNVTTEDGKTHRVNLVEVLGIIRQSINQLGDLCNRLGDEILTLRVHTGLAVPEDEDEGDENVEAPVETPGEEVGEDPPTIELKTSEDL